MKLFSRLFTWNHWPNPKILLYKEELKLTSGWLAEHEYEESLIDTKVDFAPWAYKVYSKGKVISQGSFGKALPGTRAGLRKGSALPSQDPSGVYPKEQQKAA